VSGADYEIVLNENGWDIVCYSPFEIEDRETNDVATGRAAYVIAQYFTEHSK
jgi:hypothetical protein